MKLLISVTTTSEVPAAVQGGADIIDVKNPAEGALGASPPSVICSVREATPDHLPVSAALGDVPNLPGTISLAALGAADCGVQYVKIGLMGPRRAADALRMLETVCRAVNEYAPQTLVIASAYADAQRVDAFPPRDLPALAADAGVHGCLLDTAIKSGDNLFAHLNDEQLARFVDQCHQFDLISALAGSLMATDVLRVQATGADIVGFRTAACRGDRLHGRIDAERVHQLKQLLDAA